MYVYSGKCRLCECGLKTSLISMSGKKLKTGDVVVSYVADNNNILSCLGGLSVVVCDQWQSYSDGTHKIISKYNKSKDIPDAFIMGIKKVKLGKDWHAECVKACEDVIVGEHWKDFGFSYNNI